MQNVIQEDSLWCKAPGTPEYKEVSTYEHTGERAASHEEKDRGTFEWHESGKSQVAPRMKGIVAKVIVVVIV